MAGNALKLEGSSLRCISDLVKISFKDNNYLASNGRSICTAPSECTEELLCSLHLAQIKHLEHTHLEAPTLKTYHQHAYPNSKFKKEPFQGQAIEPQQNYEDIRAPIKVGQIFYMQFYFTGQCVYYDHHNSRLILSREKRTAFKIIEHISKATPNSKEQQTYDYIGTHPIIKVRHYPLRQRCPQLAPLPHRHRQLAPVPQIRRPQRLPR